MKGLSRQISASARRSAAGTMPKRRRLYSAVWRVAPADPRPCLVRAPDVHSRAGGHPLRPSGDEYDLADVAFLQERLLRCDDVAQHECGADERADLSAFDVAQQLGEQARCGDGAAIETQVLQIERAQIQCHDGPGDGARDRVAPAAPQDLQQLRKLRAAYAINDHLDGFASEER